MGLHKRKLCGRIRGRRDQIDMLTAASERPATSTSMALAAAAHSLGAAQIDLLSAYSGAVTALFVDFLRSAGIQVAEVRSLECVHTEDSFAIDIVSEVTRFVREVGGSNPILIPDTAINTLELVGQLGRMPGGQLSRPTRPHSGTRQI